MFTLGVRLSSSTQHRYGGSVKVHMFVIMVSSCYQLTVVLTQYSPLLPPAEVDLKLYFQGIR